MGGEPSWGRALTGHPSCCPIPGDPSVQRPWSASPGHPGEGRKVPCPGDVRVWMKMRDAGAGCSEPREAQNPHGIGDVLQQQEELGPGWTGPRTLSILWAEQRFGASGRTASPTPQLCGLPVWQCRQHRPTAKLEGLDSKCGVLPPRPPHSQAAPTPARAPLPALPSLSRQGALSRQGTCRGEKRESKLILIHWRPYSLSTTN